MADQDFKIFYAWQSDSPPADNRNFIESALEIALKSMQRKGSVTASPRLDKDTKDVPGMPDIANTILEKIRTSDAFVADLTFVGKTNAEEKTDEEPIPNPNVMIELGYALSELGWERIICVINTASGSPDKLPFDLRNRRWPIDYRISTDEDAVMRKEEKQKLVKTLEDAVEKIAKLPPREMHGTAEQRLDALEEMLSKLSNTFIQYTGIATPVSELPKASSSATSGVTNIKAECQKQLDALVKRVKAGTFENMTPVQGILIIAIRPSSATTPLPLFVNGTKQMLNLELSPLYASGWDSCIRGEQFVTFSKDNGVIDAVTEITIDGNINAAGHDIVAINRKFLNAKVPEDILIIPSVAFEKNIIGAVFRYLKALKVLSTTGPWYVGIGLVNVQKSILWVDHSYAFSGRIFEGETIRPPVIEIDANTEMTDPQVIARALRPAFDYIWREHNYPQSLNYGQTGDWVGH